MNFHFLPVFVDLFIIVSFAIFNDNCYQCPFSNKTLMNVGNGFTSQLMVLGIQHFLEHVFFSFCLQFFSFYCFSSIIAVLIEFLMRHSRIYFNISVGSYYFDSLLFDSMSTLFL